MSKRTMRTIEVLAYGEHQWDGRDNAARVEKARVLYSDQDRTTERLKFCYLKNGRHARTHLTIAQEDFVDLFRSAVENGVFDADVLEDISKILRKRK